MEYSAIIHDMDKRFCYAIDKDLFVIRIQVKRDDISTDPDASDMSPLFF